MLGMLCARQYADPMSSLNGFDATKYVAFVSDEAHYSVLMSANVIGIGHQNLIKVKCDSSGRMKPESLIDEINRATENGRISLHYCNIWYHRSRCIRPSKRDSQYCS